MALLTGFTRGADPINAYDLSVAISTAISKTVEAVVLSASEITASGATISEADRTDIQTAIDNYVYNTGGTSYATLNSGKVPTTQLGGSGADNTKFLRGDQSWSSPTASAAWGSITGSIASQTDLQTALDTKQPIDSDLTAIAAIAPTNDDIIQRKAGAWVSRTMVQLKTDLALAKTDVGLANVDNTSDANKPVSTAQQTALNLKADLASPTLTGVPAAPTATAGTSTTQLATTAFVTAINNNASYRTLLDASGSHIAAKVAGTYALGMGDPLAVSGTGTLYPIRLINIVGADYPTINGITTKLRIRATVAVNAVAPTGNFTVGLYPVTSGAGGAGVKIYTMGTVVSGSAASVVTAPGANSMTNVVGSDFVIPSDGVYALAVVTTATVATSSLVHINATLQIRNA